MLILDTTSLLICLSPKDGGSMITWDVHRTMNSYTKQKRWYENNAQVNNYL